MKWECERLSQRAMARFRIVALSIGDTGQEEERIAYATRTSQLSIVAEALLQGCAGLVVIAREIAEADPELGEVRANHLLADLGTGDVRAERHQRRLGEQLFADLADVLGHRVEAGRRLAHPMHDEIALTKGRQVFLLELRVKDAGADDENAEAAIDDDFPVQRRGQDACVPGPNPAHRLRSIATRRSRRKFRRNCPQRPTKRRYRPSWMRHPFCSEC